MKKAETQANVSETPDCGMLLKMISDQIESHANRMLSQSNLTLTQFRYLVFLQDKGGEPVPFKDMEKQFQASQPTVSGVMHRLEEKHLIIIQRVEHGKSKTARLAPDGLVLIQKAGEQRSEEEALLLSALRKEERAEFKDMLFRMNRRLLEKEKTRK